MLHSWDLPLLLMMRIVAWTVTHWGIRVLSGRVKSWCSWQGPDFPFPFQPCAKKNEMHWFHHKLWWYLKPVTFSLKVRAHWNGCCEPRGQKQQGRTYLFLCQMHQVFPATRIFTCPELSLEQPGTRHLFPLTIPLHWGTWDLFGCQQLQLCWAKTHLLSKAHPGRSSCCASQHFLVNEDRKQSSQRQWFFLIGWSGARCFPFLCLTFCVWKMADRLPFLHLSKPLRSAAECVCDSDGRSHPTEQQRPHCCALSVPGEPSACNWWALLQGLV